MDSKGRRRLDGLVLSASFVGGVRLFSPCRGNLVWHPYYLGNDHCERGWFWLLTGLAALLPGSLLLHFFSPGANDAITIACHRQRDHFCNFLNSRCEPGRGLPFSLTWTNTSRCCSVLRATSAFERANFSSCDGSGSCPVGTKKNQLSRCRVSTREPKNVLRRAVNRTPFRFTIQRCVPSLKWP